jgi:hypothetical protein
LDKCASAPVLLHTSRNTLPPREVVVAEGEEVVVEVAALAAAAEAVADEAEVEVEAAHVEGAPAAAATTTGAAEVEAVGAVGRATIPTTEVRSWLPQTKQQRPATPPG